LCTKDKTPYLKWWRAKPNWGDTFSPVLFEWISGVRPRHLARENPRRLPNFVALGSILQWADESSIVWGAGFLSGEQRVDGKPHKVCAVRGPLSRQMLLRQGVRCPEVYGDPALLLPKFLHPPLTREFRLGVVPHYADKRDRRLRKLRRYEDVLLIDVQTDVVKFVEQICRCCAVASSSLHGIIVAHAFGIPARWVEFSDRVHGGGFKFRDYFAALGEPAVRPLRIEGEIEIESLLPEEQTAPLLDIDALWEACPFRSLA